MTARTFLVRGLIAGFIAGLLTFAFASTMGEPSVRAAIAVEEAASDPAHTHGGEAEPGHTHGGTAEPGHTHADEAEAGHAHGDEAEEGHSHGEEAEVSRSTQSTWGLLTATMVFGTFLGGLVGLAAAFAVGRLGRLLPAASTAVVAGLGFVSVYLAPFLKYPPNPPAVGDPGTITERTAQYFSMLLISVVAMVAAVALARTLSRTLGAYRGVVISALGYLAVVVVAALVLPSINEVPRDFSPSLLWDFRVASIGTQATLWAGIGVVLSGLIAHAYGGQSVERERRDVVGSST